MKYISPKDPLLKGLKEKWHILDKSLWKADVKKDFCTLLYSAVIFEK